MHRRRLLRIVVLTIGLGSAAAILSGCGGGQEKGMKAVWTIKGESAADLPLYWTARRMASAKPYAPELTIVARRNTTKLPYTDRAWGTSPVTPEGGRVVGKVFFEERGAPYFCTGSAVRSENRSVVMTAAHCAVDAGSCPKATNCRPHQNWIFIPSFRADKRCDGETGPGCPYGRFAAQRLFTPDQWLTEGSHRYDVAAVVVEARDNLLLTDEAGDVIVTFNAEPKRLVHAAYALFGYPEGASFKDRLWACVNRRTGRDQSRYEWFRGFERTGAEPGPAELATGCNMTAGADGGPWLTPLASGRTGLVTVTSFGADDRLSGPYFGDAARQLFELANQVKVKTD
jgi:hypothetical protein